MYENKTNMKNQELWNKYLEKNKDFYGGAIVDTAKKVVEMLEADPTPLHFGYYPDIHTAHGLTCTAADEVVKGGLSGYADSFVAEMIINCHERGEEFKETYYKKHKNDNNKL